MKFSKILPTFIVSLVLLLKINMFDLRFDFMLHVQLGAVNSSHSNRPATHLTLNVILVITVLISLLIKISLANSQNKL